MAEQPKNHNSSDEIDLGQLFQMIGRGFNKLGIAFLRLFLYLKKRAFILGGLIVLGFGIGYVLSQITEEKKKIEVIVKPNLDSENYLYYVVNEVESNIKARDTIFFKSIGIQTQNLKQFEVSVEPIENEKNKKDGLEYLELLEKFQSNSRFSEIVRSELLKKSSLNHRITITFKNSEEGLDFSEKVLNYINSTDFFRRLVKTSNENAISRIKENGLIIKQIDILIDNYSKSIIEDKNQTIDDRISLDNEARMDVTGLFQLKNILIQDSEKKKIELQEQVQPVNVLNFGKPHLISKPFYGKKSVLLPTIFLLVFFAFSGMKYLDKKAKELIY